jgi:YNFM family putative membrane transporter
MRVTLALFSAGLATFALLYCVQPILPVLGRVWRVSRQQQYFAVDFHRDAGGWPAVYRPAFDAIGRKQVMVTALVLASCCFTVDDDDQLARHSDYARADWPVAERRGGGRDDLSERGDPPQLRRLFHGAVYQRQLDWRNERPSADRGFTDFFGWRVALAVISCFALASAIMFWRILPESRHFRPSSLRPKTLLINFRLHWRDRGLPLLFLEGFLLMGRLSRCLTTLAIA